MRQSKEVLLERVSSKVLFEITRDVEVEPHPNHFCYCGSGIKYRKCCVEKEEDPPALPRVGEFDLVSDTNREHFQYGMEEEDYQFAVRGYKILFSSEEKEKKISFQLFDTLLKKYPNHPLLNNFLTVKHLITEERKKSVLAIEENLKRFPDFSLTGLLKELFDAEDTTFLYLTDPYLVHPKPEILTTQWMPYKGALTLTEFLLELSLEVHKKIVSEKLKIAGELFKTMAKTAIEMKGKDHWLLERVFAFLETAYTIRRFKVLLANSKNPHRSLNGTVSSDPKIC